MGSYEEKIKLVIQREIERGRKKFILYPFGEMGQLTKKILNEHFKIKESCIIDNKSHSGNDIYPLEYLGSHCQEDEYVLVTSYRNEIYTELRQNLKKYVSESKIIDIFKKYSNVDYCLHMAEISGFDQSESILALKRYDVKFYLPLWRTDSIQQSILFNDKYYDDENLFVATKVIGKKQIQNRAVLDIGANIGNHSVYFAKECGAGKVISFEPVEETFCILKRNIEINGLEKVIIPHNYGIGESHSRASVNGYDITNIGATSLKETSGGEIEIYSIDELNINEDIALIKIDTEGFEEKVIKGALKTIKKHMPIIMLEAWSGANTSGNIMNALEALGYQFCQVSEADYIFYIETC